MIERHTPCGRRGRTPGHWSEFRYRQRRRTQPLFPQSSPSSQVASTCAAVVLAPGWARPAHEQTWAGRPTCLAHLSFFRTHHPTNMVLCRSVKYHSTRALQELCTYSPTSIRFDRRWYLICIGPHAQQSPELGTRWSHNRLAPGRWQVPHSSFARHLFQMGNLQKPGKILKHWWTLRLPPKPALCRQVHWKRARTLKTAKTEVTPFRFSRLRCAAPLPWHDGFFGCWYSAPPISL
jgi:hypothetical protein